MHGIYGAHTHTYIHPRAHAAHTHLFSDISQPPIPGMLHIVQNTTRSTEGAISTTGAGAGAGAGAGEGEFLCFSVQACTGYEGWYHVMVLCVHICTSYLYLVHTAIYSFILIQVHSTRYLSTYLYWAHAHTHTHVYTHTHVHARTHARTFARTQAETILQSATPRKTKCQMSNVKCCSTKEKRPLCLLA